MTLEEKYENPYFKMKREAIAEGKAVGIAEGKAVGIAEGKAVGRAEGKAEGRAEVARNLLKAGVSRDIIVQATGLTIADIEN